MYLEYDLGELTIQTDGSGLWGAKCGIKRVVKLSIELWVDPEDDHTSASIKGIHKPLKESLLYTDNGVEHQIKEYLKAKGFPNDVFWSEQGMQEYGILDMDACDKITNHVLKLIKKEKPNLLLDIPQVV